MLVRAEAKVPDGLAHLAAAQQQGVLALGLAQGQLVEGEALAAGREDARARGLGEA